MKPNVHAIHNGADDNASGTVAVLLAAEKLEKALAKAPNRRTIVFVLFSAEEVGIAGSSFFVAHPPIPIEKVVAMVNLDMVGQLRDDQLIVFGTESASEWNAAIMPIAESAHLKITGRGDGYGPSDQTAFYAARIPVVHLFTGVHERYHTPEDSPESLNAEGAAKVIAFTAGLGEALAAGRLTPTYARVAAAPSMEGDSRGYGAYLGTVPDYRAMEETRGGVLLADVRKGGPADLAGIRGGDRILQMAGTKIENLYDMTFALQDHKPGETIEVVVERGGERLKLRATLGERGKSSEPSSPHPLPSGEGHGEGHGKSASAAWSPKAGKPFEKTFAGERHLADIRQLTFGGENAEAYFSPDGRKVIYQSTPRGQACDQEYVLDLTSGRVAPRLVGQGPNDLRIFSLSRRRPDHLLFDGGQARPIVLLRRTARRVTSGRSTRPTTSTRRCPMDRTRSAGSSPRDTTPRRPGIPRAGRSSSLPTATAISICTKRTRRRARLRRLTNTPGYDGGAFYSPDGSEIVWRASRPKGAELDEYRALLARGLVRPTTLEIFVMKADGTNVRQVTSNGAANFCPFFLPDGKRIIWSSNVGDPKGREFDLWMADKSGQAPERVTTAPGFDGFPHFSPDGNWIVWASNRADPASHETNLFIARWVE